MKPRILRNSGVIVVFMKGIVIWYQDRYQLAPAVTKNAPDKNLQISFHFIFLMIFQSMQFKYFSKNYLFRIGHLNQIFFVWSLVSSKNYLLLIAGNHKLLKVGIQFAVRFPIHIKLWIRISRTIVMTNITIKYFN